MIVVAKPNSAGTYMHRTQSINEVMNRSIINQSLKSINQSVDQSDLNSAMSTTSRSSLTIQKSVKIAKIDQTQTK